MASLSKRGPKSWLLQWYDSEGHKRSMSLSDIDKKGAGEIKLHVQRLVSSKKSGIGYPDSTAEWLGSIGNQLSQKLAKAGLIEERSAQTLGGFLDAYFKSRTDWKPGTRARHQTTKGHLLGYIPAETPLRSINESHADGFIRHLKELPSLKSQATQGKNFQNVRQYFSAAKRQRLIDTNPFEGLTVSRNAPSRYHFITRDEAEKVLAACPDAQWRLIFAMSRFGGVRICSEIEGLRWEHVLWDEGKILIHSPKTAHHVGGDQRFIPLFPELRPVLEQAFEQAKDGEQYVVTVARDGSRLSGAYIRKMVMQIVQRAGVKQWPKLFANMRSSRQTELERDHPSHVVCSWMGNSQKVAQKHYLQTTDDDFAKAAGKAENILGGDSSHSQNDADQKFLQALLQMAEMSGEDGKIDPRKLEKTLRLPEFAEYFPASPPHQVGLTGFEPARP